MKFKAIINPKFSDNLNKYIRKFTQDQGQNKEIYLAQNDTKMEFFTSGATTLLEMEFISSLELQNTTIFIPNELEIQSKKPNNLIVLSITKMDELCGNFSHSSYFDQMTLSLKKDGENNYLSIFYEKQQESNRAVYNCDIDQMKRNAGLQYNYMFRISLNTIYLQPLFKLSGKRNIDLFFTLQSKASETMQDADEIDYEYKIQFMQKELNLKVQFKVLKSSIFTIHDDFGKYGEEMEFWIPYRFCKLLGDTLDGNVDERNTFFGFVVDKSTQVYMRWENEYWVRGGETDTEQNLAKFSYTFPFMKD